MPSVKLFRPTKEKGRNELQVVKENLGGSKGVGIKKWPTHCRRNCTICTHIFHSCTFVSLSCHINMKPRLVLHFVVNVSTWRKSVNFLFISPKRSYRFNSRPASVRFVSQTARTNLEVIAKTRSYLFRWRPRGPPCFTQFGSLIYAQQYPYVRIHIILLTRKPGNNAWRLAYFPFEHTALKIIHLFRFADLHQMFIFRKQIFYWLYFNGVKAARH